MPQEFETAHGGEATSVTAAHEAGHALVAWLSPAIETVRGTCWVRQPDGDSRVQVISMPREPVTWYSVWEIAAISAAGMAAEVITHARFETKGCKGDLKAMREAAINLTGNGKTAAIGPWSLLQRGAAIPPFERYFEGGLPLNVADVMRASYLQAHRVILRHRGPYERLRTALIVKIDLSTEEMAEALRLPKA